MAIFRAPSNCFIFLFSHFINSVYSEWRSWCLHPVQALLRLSNASSVLLKRGVIRRKILNKRLKLRRRFYLFRYLLLLYLRFIMMIVSNFFI